MSGAALKTGVKCYSPRMLEHSMNWGELAARMACKASAMELYKRLASRPRHETFGLQKVACDPKQGACFLLTSHRYEDSGDAFWRWELYDVFTEEILESFVVAYSWDGWSEDDKTPAEIERNRTERLRLQRLETRMEELAPVPKIDF